MASLPPNFLEELRARTSITALISRSVRLTRSGREQKGCCPFHGEKTPSFYVYDDHFHCFGCGEHGDAITYLMKSTGAGFMEAVETLAREAGLDVPKASPAVAQAEQKRAGLAEILEQAAKIYQRWLFARGGKPALEYLRGRGLTDETIQKFGLGWSGEGRGALAAALRPTGVTAEQLVEAGLMKTGDHSPVDMFFSRVMFPLADRRGVKTSFSGRILGDGQPKYVNGPETALFSKRRSLYGLHLARDAVRKGAPLILVEGQMDVIALSQAGFTGAVAPLGTALTEEQLAEIWRLTPEPVICFDADAAGRRAALKTVDLALAALAPDRSIKFLRLPDREDPDSIIRREGAAAFKARLDAATPISQALYDMLAEDTARTTPEAQAGFQRRLEEAARRIPDRALASAYKDMLLKRFFAERRGSIDKPGKRNGTTKQYIRIGGIPADQVLPNDRRHFILTAIFLAQPEIFPHIEEAFAHIELGPSCERIRNALHDCVSSGENLDNDKLFTHLDRLGLGEEARMIVAVAAQDHRSTPETSQSHAISSWWHYFNMMPENISAIRLQRDALQEVWAANPSDQSAWARLIKYNELLKRAERGDYGPDT